jgi:hypothetical protein
MSTKEVCVCVCEREREREEERWELLSKKEISQIQSRDKLQLAGCKHGLVFNFRSGHV